MWLAANDAFPDSERANGVTAPSISPREHPLTHPGSIDIERGASTSLPRVLVMPKLLVSAVIALCVLPSVLTLLGFDFGSSPVPSKPGTISTMQADELTDALHRALSGSFTHALLEWTAFCIAFLTALLARLHFRIRRDVTTPIIGMALLCAGTMDAFHTLAAVRLIEGAADKERLIPFTWALSRIFHALILIFGIGVSLIWRRNRWNGSTASLGFVSVAFGVISYATVRFAATSDNLPRTMFPDSFVTRPWDIVPLVLFVLAWIMVLHPFHKRNQTLFSHSLVVAPLLLIATQLHMAFGSTALYDHHFNVAHVLKICAYAVPLTGLCLDYVRTYRDEAAARAHFEQKAQRLGQYTLEAKLGEGGVGRVYRARHVMMRRPTAVKLLLPEKAGISDLKRFEQEVQLTARLTHPNTITVFDYGRTPDGVFYYAMELLDGASLDTIVKFSGPQPAGRVIHILEAVAGALAEAHGIDLIHRDVKPANIMLCKQGGDVDVPKILDFGLVKDLGHQGDTHLTAEVRLQGTPLYMTPEAFTQPELVDARSDLYALGAVGYFLLTGHHVFESKTIVEVCSHHLRSKPIPPGERLGAPVPEDLARLILACLAKSPDERPQTASELKERLTACKDYGTWTRECRREWWESNADIIRRQPTAVDETSATLTVDVRRDR